MHVPFELIQFAHAALSNINATIPIPIQISPYYGNGAVTGATGLDLASLGTLGALGGSIFTFIKSRMGDKTSNDRTVALVDNDERTVNSLKATDYAAKDSALGYNALVMKLSENPDINKLLSVPTDANHGINGNSIQDYAKTQLDEWTQSNKEYYGNTYPMSGDSSKDPVINKSAQIAKLTTPTAT